MPLFNNSANLKLGASQIIKTYRGNSPRWAAYNAATGGTESTIVDYNGSGETWKVHRFTGNGTLNVTQAVGVFPFRVLLVGGGQNGRSTPGPGGDNGARNNGRGGNGGYVYANDTATLNTGSLSVVVGSGKSPYVGQSYGGASTLDSLTSDNGTVYGTGGNANWWAAGNAGSGGYTTTITGTSQTLAGGGGAGGNPQLNGGGAGVNGGGNGGRGAYYDGDGGGNGGSGAANTGGGGGGAGGTGDRNVHNQPRTGGYGGSGVVIVAYRIA